MWLLETICYRVNLLSIYYLITQKTVGKIAGILSKRLQKNITKYLMLLRNAMIDIHLRPIDIQNKPDVVARLQEYRKLFIELDMAIIKLGDRSVTGHRNIALARNNLEEASMHIMKAICLQG
jgi:hypothetical protein